MNRRFNLFTLYHFKSEIMWSKYSICCLLILVTFQGIAQTEEDSSIGILDKENENFNLLNSFINRSTPLVNESHQITIGNQVYIEQIGSNNVINSIISSSNSKVQLKQNGLNNEIDIHLVAASIREKITQTGDNNIVLRNVQDPSANVYFELTQEGNNHFEQYGVNSKTNNLKIKQEEGARNIIVRSFQ